MGRYQEANRVAGQLVKEKHFTVEEKQHNVALTDEGVREAENWLVSKVFTLLETWNGHT